MAVVTRDGIAFALLAGLLLAGTTAVVNRNVPGDHPLCGDEQHFVPTIRQFGHELSPRLLRTYEEMSTPLPFLLYAGWGRAFGFELTTLRWGNCLVGWLACLAVYRLAAAVRPARRERWLVAGWFLLVPYTPYLSAFVHTDMPAVLALALGLTAAVRRRWVAAGLWLAAALLCRQYLVFAPAGVAAWGVWRGWRRADRAAAAGGLLAAGLACAPLLVLCLWWGGPHPANVLHTLYAKYAFTYHPDSLGVYLAVLPWYAIPYVVREFVRTRPRGWELLAGAAAAAVPLAFPLGPSAPSVDVGIEAIGLLHRAVRGVGGVPGERLLFAVGLGLATVAVGRAVRGYRGCPPADERVLWDAVTVGFLVVMPLSYLHWEKYLLPLIPVVAVRMARPLEETP